MDQAFESFKPRFRSLEDDALNLAVHAKKYGLKQGVAEKQLQFTSLALGPGPDFDRLTALYLSLGRADLVEAHLKVDEWGAGLPHREMRRRIRHFASIGEGQRAVRCWIHYVRKNATMYWADVQDRNKVAKAAQKDPARQAELDFHQESLGRTKRLTLEAIALSAPFAEKSGTPHQQAWLTRTASEVLAEERTRVTEKPLDDVMEDALFWRLIAPDGETTAERLDLLPDRLSAYSPAAIKTFGQMVTNRLAEAYRTDIWAMAYLLMDGCSDDAFDYFRDWLLLQGKAVFDAALSAPDDFDPASLTETPLAEGLLDAVDRAYAMRTGKDLPRLKKPKVKEISPDEETFGSLLPRLAERVA